jgi:2'-5' RNA ligase
MFAIWMIPGEKDFKYLKKIIFNISYELDSPKFLPHITIYGLIDIEQKIIEETIESCKFVEAITVKNIGIKYSNNFWKTLFIEIQENDKMRQINLKLQEKFNQFSRYEFDPHISLAYKKMKSEQKNNIIEKLDVKNEFLIDKIAILKHNDNIEKWEIVKSYKL